MRSDAASRGLMRPDTPANGGLVAALSLQRILMA